MQRTGQGSLPSSSWLTIFDTGQDPIGLLGHLGTLLAHVHPPVNPNPKVPFCLAALQPLSPQPVALQGVVVAKVQDPLGIRIGKRLAGNNPDTHEEWWKIAKSFYFPLGTGFKDKDEGVAWQKCSKLETGVTINRKVYPQDPALGLVELHPIGISPSLQPIQIPLQSPSAFQQVNIPSQLGVISKFADDGLNPLI
ncbi:hypothetical protein WISP_54312 [Willisornis vidua]|uniref:Uncharacterized protein n=1 Tax=Willisornis vidua TaxID=1566151 RepID=A0ABQ9DCU1_9PASS|nr:hypothetical protein WISP_54312 [Willisornis vidua]